MKKSLRTIVTAALAAGLAIGLSGGVSAEPVEQTMDEAIELALLGPDRSPRAPERAVKAPVRRTEPSRRQQVVTPPPPPVKPFVYEKRECRSLTDAPWELNGENWVCLIHAPTYYYLDEGDVTLWTSGDHPVNKLGAMGADREFLNFDYCQRLGVWANGRIEDKSPKAIVGDMVSRIKGITCGTWTSPTEKNIAGVPVVMATGYDEFGNYFYEVVALERFGNTYAFATRTPYENRYNRQRKADLAWMITHIHPTEWVE